MARERSHQRHEANIRHPMDLFRDLEPPLIMGILNVTPDSFSDGGSYPTTDDAVQRALQMVSEGADMVDIGGESTRPFAAPVSLEEEMGRVLPVIEGLYGRTEAPISIDTKHAEVAEAALDSGAAIVNDVNALRAEGMAELVIERGATAVLMHMKGTPENMQVSPYYDDVVSEVRIFLEDRIEQLVSMGMRRDRIVIDPGIGFGKRVIDNLVLLRDLSSLLDIGCPVMVGTSRKSFIGKVQGTDVHERLEGSLTSALVAAMNGASILRVHDVRSTRRALEVYRAIREPDRFAMF